LELGLQVLPGLPPLPRLTQQWLEEPLMRLTQERLEEQGAGEELEEEAAEEAVAVPEAAPLHYRQFPSHSSPSELPLPALVSMRIPSRQSKNKGLAHSKTYWILLTTKSMNW
jgi:hypothetical protein